VANETLDLRKKKIPWFGPMQQIVIGRRQEFELGNELGPKGHSLNRPQDNNVLGG
jgi:hypothetical protein